MAILKKLKSADDAATEDQITVLQRRIAEMQLRDGVLTKQVLDFEKSASSKPHYGTEHAEAEALLEGKLFDARQRLPISQLAALHAERDVLRRALKIGNDRLARLMDERAEVITASFLGEITQIERSRVSAALALQKVNRQREALRDKIAPQAEIRSCQLTARNFSKSAIGRTRFTGQSSASSRTAS
jgi:hypothetical protein